jgi:hypothetical protein
LISPVMNADPIWFYEQQGERRGPVSRDELFARLSAGEITPATLVWREGLADWIPFSSSELASVATTGKTPPPMPPVLSPAPTAMPRPPIPFTPRAARLRPGFQPRLRHTYGRAWNSLTTRFWPLVGCFALSSILLGVASQFYAPIFFLMFPLMGGLYWYNLLHLRGEAGSVETLFEGFRRQFGPLAILNLISTGISLVLIIVPMILLIAGLIFGAQMIDRGDQPPGLGFGIMLGAMLLFFILCLPILIVSMVGNLATLLSLDCGLTARESLSLAWVATKPHLVKITLFMITNAALSMLGFIALYFGMFITGAWSTLAFVQLYEDAFGDEPGA